MDLGALSAHQLKMDAMRADERKIFATTKAKSKFNNVYSCRHSLNDIMRATDVVFGGKRAFCVAVTAMWARVVLSSPWFDARVFIAE